MQQSIKEVMQTDGKLREYMNEKVEVSILTQICSLKNTDTGVRLPRFSHYITYTMWEKRQDTQLSLHPFLH